MSEILKKLDQLQNEMPRVASSMQPAADSGARKTLREAQFMSRQLAGRMMSAVRKTMGSAVQQPTRSKTLLLGSFAAGFTLILVGLFLLPSSSGKRSAKPKTTVQAPRRAAPISRALSSSAERSPAMTSAKTAVPNSTAPSERELQLIKSMEDIYVAYDRTVRNNKQKIIQYLKS
jgi:hypothetical protein